MKRCFNLLSQEPSTLTVDNTWYGAQTFNSDVTVEGALTVSQIAPATTGTIDLGSATKKFKNVYANTIGSNSEPAVAWLDTANVTSTLTAGNISTGAITGSSSPLFVNGSVGLDGDNSYNLADPVNRYKNIYGITLFANSLTSSSSSTALALTGSGTLPVSIGTNGLQFQNSTTNYVAGNLAYYEGPTTVAVAFTGAWSSSFNWTFQRIGNLVNVTFPTMRVTATAASSLTAATNTIPARFRPANTVRLQVVGTSNAIDQGQVFIDLLSTGSITVINSPPSPNFTNAALCGPYGSSFTYSL